MVAASTLRKLSNDLDAIGARLKPKFGGVLFVRMPGRLGPYKDRVIDRHKEMFAEDREAELCVFATIYEDAPGKPLGPLNLNDSDGDEAKYNQAWRSVARDLIREGIRL